ncbi:MAG: hypothetical protein HZA04_04055 [Nitrospinae bacterium]|nr:hypothetical protein [Nitrospinota bacterium]
MKKPILSAVKAAARRAHGIRAGKAQGTKRGAKGYNRKRAKKVSDE